MAPASPFDVVFFVLAFLVALFGFAAIHRSVHPSGGRGFWWRVVGARFRWGLRRGLRA